MTFEEFTCKKAFYKAAESLLLELNTQMVNPKMLLFPDYNVIANIFRHWYNFTSPNSLATKPPVAI